MTAACRDQMEFANLDSSNVGTNQPNVGTKQTKVGNYQRRLHSCLRALWPVKLPSTIEAVTGISRSQAIGISSANPTRRISLDVMIELLWSEDGYHFLAATMTGCKAEWWTQIVKANELAAAKRDRRMIERRIQRIEDEL